MLRNTRVHFHICTVYASVPFPCAGTWGKQWGFITFSPWKAHPGSCTMTASSVCILCTVWATGIRWGVWCDVMWHIMTQREATQHSQCVLPWVVPVLSVTQSVESNDISVYLSILLSGIFCCCGCFWDYNDIFFWVQKHHVSVSFKAVKVTQRSLLLMMIIKQMK